MWKQGKTTWYTGENRGFNEVTGILKQETGEIAMNELKFMARMMIKDWIPNRQNDVESDWLGKHRKQIGDKIDFHCSKIN